MRSPTFDAEGYPTPYTLGEIRRWDPQTPGFLAFCEEAWNKHYGSWEPLLSADHPSCTQVYSVSTGGWSGNESIIGAMQRNWVMWAVHWLMSSRGGHYQFEERQGQAE